ncbi:hypothetical protein G6514_006395 [Epicoccum nigrum]|nr:hypothetical protein G6514_006395 [Epicoccum nigrum]
MDRIHRFYHGPPDDPARDLEFANWLVDEFPAVYEERIGHPMTDEQHQHFIGFRGDVQMRMQGGRGGGGRGGGGRGGFHEGGGFPEPFGLHGGGPVGYPGGGSIALAWGGFGGFPGGGPVGLQGRGRGGFPEGGGFLGGGDFPDGRYPGGGYYYEEDYLY